MTAIDLDVDVRLQRAAAIGWRLLVLAAVVVAALWLTGKLLVVVLPLVAAVLLARALAPLHRRLVGRVGSGVAAAACTLLAVLAVGALLGLVSATIATEADQLGDAIDTALDDAETWLVDSGPGDISRADIERWREEATAAVRRAVSDGQGALTSGAVLAGEVAIGVILALVLTFFVLRDGGDLVQRAIARDERRRLRLEQAARRSWSALGAYLRGAATLGAIEGTVIGLAMWLAGAQLVVPVMVVTFMLAFIPIVGAVTAGVLAVLVTLATAGLVPALIVGVVVIVVQQLDNDLLAPWIYGSALHLHPVVILVGVVAGGALFGVVGTVLAVPVLAVTLNAAAGWREAGGLEAPMTIDDE